MFRILKRSTQSRARCGRIATPHGALQTPAFLPDATRACVRTLEGSGVARAGIASMVVNTYHLMLAPGIARVKQLGGAGRMMSWSGPLVSDSGGFQVFSLVHAKKGQGIITEDGARFRSPVSGAWHSLTPAKSIKIQFDLGTDIMVCFDDPPPNSGSAAEFRNAVAHTISWARRCKQEFEKQVKKRRLASRRPGLIAVIQGGTDALLREQCAQALIEIGFDGYGYGGRPVDSNGNFMQAILEKTAAAIPEQSVRFALGVGKPEDIVRSVRMGWDLFDCVIPTREARHGRLYYEKGERVQRASKIKHLSARADGKKDFYATAAITNARYAADSTPISSASVFPELRAYTKAYLHHLFKVQEPLAHRLATMNNLEFYARLMVRIRKGIRAGLL